MHRKATAAGWAGAVTIVIVWVAGILGLEVPDYVAQAFTVLISTAAAAIR